MKVLSAVRMTGKSSRILGWVFAVVILAVGVPAIFSNDVSFSSVLPALAILVVAFAAVLKLRVEIATDSETVRIRLRPFYAKQLKAQNIVSVVPEAATGVAEGYGYRVLGKGRRGLLVGGPSIKIETTEKTWVVSCENPHEASHALTTVVNSSQDR